MLKQTFENERKSFEVFFNWSALPSLDQHLLNNQSSSDDFKQHSTTATARSSAFQLSRQLLIEDPAFPSDVSSTWGSTQIFFYLLCQSISPVKVSSRIGLYPIYWGLMLIVPLNSFCFSSPLVCMNALTRAVSYCREEHMTCRDCAQDTIDQARRNHRPESCPQCRQTPARLKPCIAITRIVDSLQWVRFGMSFLGRILADFRP